MKRNGTVGNSRFRIQQHLINIKNNNNNISSSSKNYFNNNNGNKYDFGEILLFLYRIVFFDQTTKNQLYDI